MSKIFLFAIGGTGSRVLRSLTMLLASGVRMGVDEIVPIIIDPDTSNADLTRTVALLNNYTAIRKDLQFSGENTSQFFRTSITRILPNYTLRIKDTDDKSFRDFIDFASMSRDNQALVKMLFSDKNLNSSMNVGFKGNPNIGSVVLNQIAHSEDFKKFVGAFSAGDRIFIISSIFGGTGASGFPLLLKTLRYGNGFTNHNVINKACIGALTVLPYFRLNNNPDSSIDSSTFISKTKSALAYYENNISRSGSIDALYYLADDIRNAYENNEGGSAQRNDAHLVEMLGATAIVDFSLRDFYSPSNVELGIRDNQNSITFASFYPRMHEMLYYPLVQFAMMVNAMTYNGQYFKSDRFNANKENFKDLYTSGFYRQLEDFFRSFTDWLKELKGNNRSLDLFNMECRAKPFDLVIGVKPKRILAKYSDYDLIAARLNSAVGKCDSKGKENKFLEMCYLATHRLVSEKLSN